MMLLGNGLGDAGHHEDALSVQKTELATLRRIGAPEANILDVQSNLAITYEKLGRREEALSTRREVYSGRLKLSGEENKRTLVAANNYAISLGNLERFEEARSLMRKLIPVVRRVLGEVNDLTLSLRTNYAMVLYKDPAATLDDVREAVNELEDTERTARQVLGGTHPLTTGFEGNLRRARELLRAREDGKKIIFV